MLKSKKNREKKSDLGASEESPAVPRAAGKARHRLSCVASQFVSLQNEDPASPSHQDAAKNQLVANDITAVWRYKA